MSEPTIKNADLFLRTLHNVVVKAVNNSDGIQSTSCGVYVAEQIESIAKGFCDTLRQRTGPVCPFCGAEMKQRAIYEYHAGNGSTPERIIWECKCEELHE